MYLHLFAGIACGLAVGVWLGAWLTVRSARAAAAREVATTAERVQRAQPAAEDPSAKGPPRQPPV